MGTSFGFQISKQKGMKFISKAAGLAMFLLLLTAACGGGSSPASGGSLRGFHG